ncbi:MAG: LacI family DNA-binding transcriptional regulator [Vallitaleaceae bacterium]|nr:LacI family DNA-binding transcriptional regulator [Vallitaleaceae bacterium]
MATIKDVAKAAGVSTATVSRVINDNYPVHVDTKARVKEVIEQLNFKPNAVARGLKNKETFLVGMITPDLSNPFFMEIAKGIESQIAGYGYNIVFCSSDEMDVDKELRMLEMLHEKQVDAVILDTRNTQAAQMNAYVDLGMKLVLIDAKLPGAQADLVTEDNYESSLKAIRYAVAMGHKKIAVVKGNMKVSTALERFRAYKDVLKENDLKFNPSYCLEGGYERQTAYSETLKMLSVLADDLPTLIFSTNNRMTEGVMLALAEKGLRIPEDISLISFGDISMAELVRPRLAVIEQRPYEIGTMAGDLLLKRLKPTGEHQEFSHIELEVHFRKGQSVKKM